MGSKGDQSDFGHTSPYSVLIWLITHRQPANNAKETKLDQQKWNRAVEIGKVELESIQDFVEAVTEVVRGLRSRGENTRDQITCAVL